MKNALTILALCGSLFLGVIGCVTRETFGYLQSGILVKVEKGLRWENTKQVECYWLSFETKEQDIIKVWTYEKPEAIGSKYRFISYR